MDLTENTAVKTTEANTVLNTVLIEDIERTLKLPLLKELCGKTVLITGATGLIGQTLTRVLLQYGAGEGPEKKIHVIACVRDREKADRLFEGFESGNLTYLVCDIASLHTKKAERKVDYMIHAASQTSSRAFVEQPVETIFTAVNGTRSALEFARQNEVQCFVYLSTMEVYGAPVDDEKIDEKHGTNLDTMQPRSCYPESKRLCEVLCASWQKEYGVPVRVLRLKGRDIVLKTEGLTCRSYLYTADAVSAILTVLLRGSDGEAYNAANEETYCSIREMADLAARECAEGKIKVRIEADKDPSVFGYAPTLHMNLDTSKLRALGWHPSCGLAEAYRRMIKSMQP